MTPLPGWPHLPARQVPVAKEHESIDLTTLEEVHRLLRTTEFATVDDLLDRTDGAELGNAVERMAVPSWPSPAGPANHNSMGLAPLPRRR